jgi:tetratricopeptide (TPR) repeat protein
LAYFNYANSLKATDRKDAALENYDRAITLHPSFSLAFNNRGNLLESMARYEESSRSFTRAIELDPGYARAYSSRGSVEEKLGNYSRARRDFSRAVDLDPWRPENPKQDSNFKFRLYINLGDIQMYFKEFDKALAIYDRAAEIEPNNLDVAGFRGNALAALGNLSEGLQLRQESFGLVSFDISNGVSIIHGRVK